MSLTLDTRSQPWARIWTCDTCKTTERTPHDAGPLHGHLPKTGWTFGLLHHDKCPNCTAPDQYLDLLELLETP